MTISRSAFFERNTEETKIKLDLNIDGTGKSKVETGIGFFNHMLVLFAKHGFFDLDLEVKGDLYVDTHHTVEDVGIVLGKAIAKALGDKAGIKRYGNASIPIDEALSTCVLDISGRPFLNFDVKFSVPRIGELDTEMIEEFFRAISVHAGLTIHIFTSYGSNNHHIAESIFKAFGHSLSQACTIDPRITGVLSTKGMLE